MSLISEYDRFCQAFAEKSIETNDFMELTRQLLGDKLDENLLDLIVILPQIEQQNELYSIWKKKEVHPVTTKNTTNWTKKDQTNRTIYQCRVCQQIMFNSDAEEHNGYHPELENEFPSLPSAAVSIGRMKSRR
jgi:hypothetical protein